ncbi:MAG: alpha/beta fold hydrolase [Deferrisomatales bacterium]
MTYESEGSGAPVVLIPGLGCDTRLWRPVGERLRTRFRVLYPHTWDQGGIYRAAQEVAGLLDELGLDRVAVAGLSMGGYVAFELLRHWPHRVRAAALLDTTAFADTADRAEKRHQVLRLLHAGQFPEVLAAFAASVLSPAHAAGGAVRDLVLAMGRDLGPEAFGADVQAILKRGSYEDVLPLVRVPALFVAGEHDALTPVDAARAMAREVPGARVEVIPGAGHLPPLEAPEPVARLLASFFGGPADP